MKKTRKIKQFREWKQYKDGNEIEKNRRLRKGSINHGRNHTSRNSHSFELLSTKIESSFSELGNELSTLRHELQTDIKEIKQNISEQEKSLEAVWSRSEEDQWAENCWNVWGTAPDARRDISPIARTQGPEGKKTSHLRHTRVERICYFEMFSKAPMMIRRKSFLTYWEWIWKSTLARYVSMPYIAAEKAKAEW